VANTLSFPKKGILRIYHNLSGIQQVVQLTIAGVAKTITLPAKSATASIPMNFGDATFEVEAGSSASVADYLNSTSGVKLKGWVNATDQVKCGVNSAVPIDLSSQLAYVQTKLAGESIFAYQCWEDDDSPGEFNDVYMIWTYAPTTAVSPSPSSTTASATASPSPSPSPSRAASPSPSTSPTPTPSPRVTMPDTSEGTPVTGVFEVTVGAISVGLILLVLGVFGLLAL